MIEGKRDESIEAYYSLWMRSLWVRQSSQTEDQYTAKFSNLCQRLCAQAQGCQVSTSSGTVNTN